MSEMGLQSLSSLSENIYLKFRYYVFTVWALVDYSVIVD